MGAPPRTGCNGAPLPHFNNDRLTPPAAPFGLSLAAPPCPPRLLLAHAPSCSCWMTFLTRVTGSVVSGWQHA